METIMVIFEQVPAWITALLAVMVAVKGFVALTPTPADDKIVGKIYKVLELISLTIGKAKDQPTTKGGTGGQGGKGGGG